MQHRHDKFNMIKYIFITLFLTLIHWKRIIYFSMKNYIPHHSVMCCPFAYGSKINDSVIVEYTLCSIYLVIKAFAPSQLGSY